jgi:hypothetical protein
MTRELLEERHVVEGLLLELLEELVAVQLSEFAGLDAVTTTGLDGSWTKIISGLNLREPVDGIQIDGLGVHVVEGLDDLDVRREGWRKPGAFRLLLPFWIGFLLEFQ